MRGGNAFGQDWLVRASLIASPLVFIHVWICNFLPPFSITFWAKELICLWSGLRCAGRVGSGRESGWIGGVKGFKNKAFFLGLVNLELMLSVYASVYVISS